MIRNISSSLPYKPSPLTPRDQTISCQEQPLHSNGNYTIVHENKNKPNHIQTFRKYQISKSQFNRKKTYLEWRTTCNRPIPKLKYNKTLESNKDFQYQITNKAAHQQKPQTEQMVQVLCEHMQTTLKEVNKLTLEQSIYCLCEMLFGFKSILQFLGWVQISTQFCGFNKKGEMLVWICEDLLWSTSASKNLLWGSANNKGTPAKQKGTTAVYNLNEVILTVVQVIKSKTQNPKHPFYSQLQSHKHKGFDKILQFIMKFKTQHKLKIPRKVVAMAGVVAGGVGNIQNLSSKNLMSETELLNQLSQKGGNYSYNKFEVPPIAISNNNYYGNHNYGTNTFTNPNSNANPNSTHGSNVFSNNSDRSISNNNHNPYNPLQSFNVNPLAKTSPNSHFRKFSQAKQQKSSIHQHMSNKKANAKWQENFLKERENSKLLKESMSHSQSHQFMSGSRLPGERGGGTGTEYSIGSRIMANDIKNRNENNISIAKEIQDHSKGNRLRLNNNMTPPPSYQNKNWQSFNQISNKNNFGDNDGFSKTNNNQNNRYYQQNKSSKVIFNSHQQQPKRQDSLNPNLNLNKKNPYQRYSTHLNQYNKNSTSQIHINNKESNVMNNYGHGHSYTPKHDNLHNSTGGDYNDQFGKINFDSCDRDNEFYLGSNTHRNNYNNEVVTSIQLLREKDNTNAKADGKGRKREIYESATIHQFSLGEDRSEKQEAQLKANQHQRIQRKSNFSNGSVVNGSLKSSQMKNELNYRTDSQVLKNNIKTPPNAVRTKNHRKRICESYSMYYLSAADLLIIKYKEGDYQLEHDKSNKDVPQHNNYKLYHQHEHINLARKCSSPLPVPMPFAYSSSNSFQNPNPKDYNYNKASMTTNHRSSAITQQSSLSNDMLEADRLKPSHFNSRDNRRETNFYGNNYTANNTNDLFTSFNSMEQQATNKSSDSGHYDYDQRAKKTNYDNAYNNPINDENRDKLDLYNGGRNVNSFIINPPPPTVTTSDIHHNHAHVNHSQLSQQQQPQYYNHSSSVFATHGNTYNSKMNQLSKTTTNMNGQQQYQQFAFGGLIQEQPLRSNPDREEGDRVEVPHPHFTHLVNNNHIETAEVNLEIPPEIAEESTSRSKPSSEEEGRSIPRSNTNTNNKADFNIITHEIERSPQHHQHNNNQSPLRKSPQHHQSSLLLHTPEHKQIKHSLQNQYNTKSIEQLYNNIYFNTMGTHQGNNKQSMIMDEYGNTRVVDEENDIKESYIVDRVSGIFGDVEIRRDGNGNVVELISNNNKGFSNNNGNNVSGENSGGLLGLNSGNNNKLLFNGGFGAGHSLQSINAFGSPLNTINKLMANGNYPSGNFECFSRSNTPASTHNKATANFIEQERSNWNGIKGLLNESSCFDMKESIHCGPDIRTPLNIKLEMLGKYGRQIEKSFIPPSTPRQYKHSESNSLHTSFVEDSSQNPTGSFLRADTDRKNSNGSGEKK